MNKRFDFDLHELQLGFGAPIFTSLQDTTVQGYNFTVELKTDEEINDCDDFFDALFGPLNGFWLPAPMGAMQISAAVDTTHFDIIDQSLADSWTEQRDLHLYFTRDGYTAEAAKITNVTDLGTGYERITLDTAVNLNLLHPATKVNRLHYVRLASDEEDGEFQNEGWFKNNFRVVELPQEYAQAETGQRPVWLYEFTLGNPAMATWRYTSFAVNVTSSGHIYTAWKLTHGAIREGLKLQDETVTVEAAFYENLPLALFVPFAPSAKMFIKISEIDYTAPDTQKIRFVGEVKTVKDAGDRLIATCESFISILNRKWPRMQMQPDCNNHLFDPGCKLNRVTFTKQSTIGSLASNAEYPPYILTTGVELIAPATNAYRGGFLFTGSGATYEVRTILASFYSVESSHQLKLNLPLRFAQAGQIVRFTPGCDGKAATCKAFKNFVNFAGFISIPDRNPAIEAGGLPVSKGGKK